MTEGTGTVADRLSRLGRQLPPPPASVAAFEPYVRHGGTIDVPGQIAVRNGRLAATGRPGTVGAVAQVSSGAVSREAQPQ